MTCGLNGLKYGLSIPIRNCGKLTKTELDNFLTTSVLLLNRIYHYS